MIASYSQLQDEKLSSLFSTLYAPTDLHDICIDVRVRLPTHSRTTEQKKNEKEKKRKTDVIFQAIHQGARNYNTSIGAHKRIKRKSK